MNTNTDDGGALFADSLHSIDHENNLGSSQVVRRILGQFIADFTDCDSEREVLLLIDKVAGIFSGVAPGYLRVPGWESQAGLCYSLAVTYGVNDRQYKHHTVRDALAIICTEVMALAERHDGNDEGLQAGTEAILDKAVAAFTGTAETLIKQGVMDAT